MTTAAKRLVAETGEKSLQTRSKLYVNLPSSKTPQIINQINNIDSVTNKFNTSITDSEEITYNKDNMALNQAI